MGVLQIKVIMLSINIGWYNTGKQTSIRILLVVCPAKKYHSFINDINLVYIPNLFKSVLGSSSWILFRHWSLRTHMRKRTSLGRSVVCDRTEIGRLCFAHGCQKYEWKGPLFISKEENLLAEENESANSSHQGTALDKCLLSSSRPCPKWVPSCCQWKTQLNG